MAIIHTCDGCGEPIEPPGVDPHSMTAVLDAPADQRGWVMPGRYCPHCIGVVDEFLRAVDAGHEAAAELFEARLSEAREAFYQRRPKGRLPDERPR